MLYKQQALLAPLMNKLWTPIFILKVIYGKGKWGNNFNSYRLKYRLQNIVNIIQLRSFSLYKRQSYLDIYIKNY